MDFSNEFRVSLPVESAWELFNDVERLAPCMPGATLTGVDGDEFHGTVKVKVGPVTVMYKGVASFEERDAANRTVRLKAAGRETRGQGNAEAHITVRLAEDGDGDGTQVSVETRLSVTGKVAQFGKSVMEEISRKLLGQFTTCLEDRLAAEREPAPEPPTDAAAEPTPQPTPSPEPTPQPAPQPGAAPGAQEAAGATAATAGPGFGADDSEPLDLLGLAGGALLKRLAPVAAGLLVALGLAAWLRGHGRWHRHGHRGCHGRGSRRA
jgi:uncharacterized protein